MLLPEGGPRGAGAPMAQHRWGSWAGQPRASPGRFWCSREGLLASRGQSCCWQHPLSCAVGELWLSPFPLHRQGVRGQDPEDMIFSSVRMVFVSLKDLCGAQV